VVAVEFVVVVVDIVDEYCVAAVVTTLVKRTDDLVRVRRHHRCRRRHRRRRYCIRYRYHFRYYCSRYCCWDYLCGQKVHKG